jgi:hypothetical protein
MRIYRDGIDSMLEKQHHELVIFFVANDESARQQSLFLKCIQCACRNQAEFVGHADPPAPEAVQISGLQRGIPGDINRKILRQVVANQRPETGLRRQQRTYIGTKTTS